MFTVYLDIDVKLNNYEVAKHTLIPSKKNFRKISYFRTHDLRYDFLGKVFLEYPGTTTNVWVGVEARFSTPMTLSV